MKQSLLCFAALCCLVCHSSTVVAATPKLYAIVIGISDYKDEAIPNLKFAEKDAKAFYDFLRSPYSGAIPEENIAFLTGPNASRSNILKYAVDIFRRSTKDDMVIFYFSGHGKGDPSDNSGYLLGYDSENDNEAATALSMDELKSKIDRCQAKLKVSYVDACHAGLFKSYNTKGTMEDNNEIIALTYQQSVQNAGDGNVAFLASSARQQSLEDDKLGNGVFTYFLLKGLKGDADKEQKDATGYNDGLITVGEMATYLGNKIPAATKYKQKPTVDGTYDEDFPLSILKSNVVIASEIAKRPERKTTSGFERIIAASTVIKVPDDKKLSEGMTYSNYTCYGMYSFVSQLKEPVLLYKMKGFGAAESTNIPLTPSHTANTPRLWAGGQAFAKDCNGVYDYIFSFKKIKSDGNIQYAYIKVPVEAGLNKFYLLSEQTIFFSDKEYQY